MVGDSTVSLTIDGMSSAHGVELDFGDSGAGSRLGGKGADGDASSRMLGAVRPRFSGSGFVGGIRTVGTRP